MKRILFHYPVLNVGGAEMSVLRLTRALADRGWSVDLVVTTGGGALEGAVDPRVRLRRLRARPSGAEFLAAKGLAARLRLLPDLVSYGLQRAREIVVTASYWFRRYDAAVVALHGLSPSFCCRHVRARRVLHWIRNDLSQVGGLPKVRRGIDRFHPRTDWYVCVSDYARRAFVAMLPHLEAKAVTLYNVIDVQGMRARAQKAENPYLAYGDALRVVTVGRLSDEAKALFRMVRVCRRLRDEGLDFYWFIVGDGPDRERLEALVAEFGLADRLILVGQREDPFGYYRYADVCATLSYYEGLCGTVNEAKALFKPVIATEFSGIREQIVDGEGGLVVANDEDAIVEGMRRILIDAELRQKMSGVGLPEAIADDAAKLDRLEAIIAEVDGS